MSGKGRTPRRAAVLGHPIEHSLSPVLHRAAYAALGLDDWSYDAVDVTEESLPAFVRELDPSWAGVSLTMPLKRAVLPLLHELRSPADVLGVVNTVTVAEEGRLVGDNTDVEGLAVALREAGVTRPGTACVLGAGATAVSAVASLRELACAAVTVYARSAGRAAAVVDAGGRVGVDVEVAPWSQVGECLASDVVVSTVPAGAADELAGLLARGHELTTGVLLDVVYVPWPTALGQTWASLGGAVVGGFEMLLHQAAAQVQLMTGSVAPVGAMRTAGERALVGG